MGDVGADVLVGQQQLLDPVKKAIEGARERRQVVVNRRQRDPAAPLAAHDPLGGEPHRVDAPQELRAEPETACGSEHDRRADGPAESGHDAAQRIIHAAQFIADDQGRSIGETRDVRANNFRLCFGRLIALGFRHFDPTPLPTLGRAPGQGKIARQALAFRTFEPIGQRAAARSAGLDQAGQPIASLVAENALKRVRLLRDPVVEIGQDLVANRSVNHDPERQRRKREQQQIDRRKPETGRPDEPIREHATNILRRARSGSGAAICRGRSCSAGGSCGSRRYWFADRSETPTPARAASCG